MSQTTKTHGESFSVPSGVTTVVLTLRGEPGGGDSDAAGGEGGIVEGEYGVAGGDTLYIRGSGSAGAGGTGGGSLEHASDGGDYIDVRYNGTALTDEIAVAAGGGGGGDGGGTGAQSGPGGAGGADTGEDGSGSNPGGGGTQSAGGSAGGSDATSGSREVGGDGGDFDPENGGGGGGGYYGGGGGGIDTGTEDGSGGGGGSNFDDSLATVTTNQQGGWTSSPEVVIEYAPEPTGVAIDGLTETAQGEVEVDASATQGYDSDSTWTVYRSTDGTQGSQVHTETGDGDLLWTDTNAPTGDVVYYTVELSNSSGSDSAQQSLIVRGRGSHRLQRHCPRRHERRPWLGCQPRAGRRPVRDLPRRVVGGVVQRLFADRHEFVLVVQRHRPRKRRAILLHGPRDELWGLDLRLALPGRSRPDHRPPRTDD